MSFDKFTGGTEAMFKLRRNVSFVSRVGTSIDEGHRKLDPLPDRLYGRKIAVSPMIDDEKGKGVLARNVLFGSSFSQGSRLICNVSSAIASCILQSHSRFLVFSLFRHQDRVVQSPVKLTQD